MVFLGRSFSLLACLSDTLPDLSCFPQSLFSPRLLLFAISFISTTVSFSLQLLHLFPFSPRPNPLVNLMAPAWLQLIAYPVGILM